MEINDTEYALPEMVDCIVGVNAPGYPTWTHVDCIKCYDADDPSNEVVLFAPIIRGTDVRDTDFYYYRGPDTDGELTHISFLRELGREDSYNTIHQPRHYLADVIGMDKDDPSYMHSGVFMGILRTAVEETLVIPSSNRV